MVRTKFRAHLNVTFHANTKPNLVNSVDLSALQFIGTVRPDGPDRPWPAVISRIEPIALHLATDGERRPLQDVAVRAPKDVLATAEHVGFGVTDGHRLWPIPLVV